MFCIIAGLVFSTFSVGVLFGHALGYMRAEAFAIRRERAGLRDPRIIRPVADRPE